MKPSFCRIGPGLWLGLLASLVLVFETSARIFVATNSTWRYFKGTSEASDPTNAWRDVEYDDSAWLVGTAPLHYGTNALGGDDNLTAGTILSDMANNYSCIYMRQQFVIADPNKVGSVELRAWFDDGLAIWINGQAVGTPLNVGSLVYTNTARNAREGSAPWPVPVALSLLHQGTNVLCLQAFNRYLTNDDFRIDVELAKTASKIAFAAYAYTVREDAGRVDVQVVRTGGLDAGTTVDYVSTNINAESGLDYEAVAGTLTFEEGQSEQTVTVSILNDGLHEGGESFRILLSNPSGGAALGPLSSTTVQITDNDSGFEVEYSLYYAQEHSGSLVIGVKRGNDGDQPLSVDYFTSDQTAVAGEDYTATTGTLSFASGESVKLVSIPILNEALKEGRETFLFTLQNPSAGTVLGHLSFATNTIFESDRGVRFERTLKAVHEFERELRVTVLRGNDINLGPFTVGFGTVNLTATAGLDYVGTNGTLSFGAGEMQQSFTVQILNDDVLEPDRQFRIVLGPVSGDATLGDPTNTIATVTVCDDTDLKPHRFGGLQVSTDGTVRLTLEGGVSARFKPFFDLYPVEVSSNLVDWIPLCTLVRTNASTNELVYADLEARDSKARFYRMAATNLIAPNLAPTGPYAVGRVDRLVTDPARRNRYTISTNSSFMVAIWYPAVAEAGRRLLPFDDDPKTHDPDFWGTSWLDRAPWLCTYARGDLKLATNEAPYPIVFQSVGATGTRTDLQNHAENLASHGYVVVAPDHRDAWAVVYPDGSYLQGSEMLLGPEGREYLTEATMGERLTDLAFLMNQLEQWNQTDPLFAGQLNLNMVAGIGFSWGAPAVAEFCRLEPRSKGAIILDGALLNVPDLLQHGLFKPFLSIYQASWSESQLFDRATTNAFWFQISGSVHGQFSAYYWYGTPGAIDAGHEMARTIMAYQVSFLNKYLKGQDNHLLDGPPGSLFPRVINFRKK